MVVLQVKDCYLLHLVEELHDTQNEIIILFTHTCRSVSAISIATLYLIPAKFKTRVEAVKFIHCF